MHGKEECNQAHWQVTAEDGEVPAQPHNCAFPTWLGTKELVTGIS